jgi:hypothetical protein
MLPLDDVSDARPPFAPVPRFERSVVAVDPPGAGEGHWAGAPSSVLADDGTIYLAYRLRRPVGAGRGYGTVVAHSHDGVNFETVATLDREAFECDSLERPAIVQRPDGGWRCYLSCATPGTLHWRIDALDADTPAALPSGARTTVFEGDRGTAYKDPVVMQRDGRWEAWVCRHLVADAAEADAMASVYATSADGLAWELHGVALEPTPDRWDQRGTRIASVLPSDITGGPFVAYYDGRRNYAENWFERTGLAFGDGPGRFEVLADEPAAVSPHGRGALRYVSVIALPDGGLRFYFEATRPDGAHDLRTEYVPPTR